MRKITKLALSAAAALLASAFGADRAEAQVVTNDCFYCVPCNYQGQGYGSGHRVLPFRVPQGSQGLTVPEPYECGAGPCSNPQDELHEFCIRGSSSAFNLNSLTDAVNAGDMAQVAVLVEQGGDAVEVNTARSALQVVGCSGAIVAHLPLTQVQLAQLTTSSVRLAAAE